jgi:hypothetical protein
MNARHAELVRRAIPLWYAHVAWARELLVRAFNFADPQEILRPEHRRVQRVPNTCWVVRPHGIGVDIYRTPEVGGIDFDFDKPNPDEWRLSLFIERQVNDGQLPYELYQELVNDEELLKKTVREVLNGA